MRQAPFLPSRCMTDLPPAPESSGPDGVTIIAGLPHALAVGPADRTERVREVTNPIAPCTIHPAPEPSEPCGVTIPSGLPHELSAATRRPRGFMGI